MATTKDKPKADNDQYAEVLSEARARFEDVTGRDKQNRAAQREDTEFVYIAGSQWNKQVRARWGQAPTLEFPQLKQFVNQVVNDQRQNRPGVLVHPAGSDASEETAEIIQGLIRHIEYDSQAEAAYDNGFQHAVVGGRGYWRIVTEYEKQTSFDQKLVIRPIEDPLMVYADPDYQMPDGSDISYAFICEVMDKDAFQAKYPKANAVSWDPAEQTSAWYDTKDQVVVADYYRRIVESKTLVALSDGNTLYKDDLERVTLPEGVEVVDERPSESYRVEYYKIAGGAQVLESNEWPGTMIPLVCCFGDSVMIAGKRTYQGLIRQARDAQRMYNYEKSIKARRLMNAARAPYVAPAAAIEGYENVWKSANNTDTSILPYNHVDDAGNPIPPPVKTPPAPVETGWVEAAQSDKEDLKSIIGMYQNSLGMQGGEKSGRAILARERQGDNSTFHYVDNMSRAIALTGRIILEVLPVYYDKRRMVSVIKQDDTRDLVEINSPGVEVDEVTGAVNAIVKHDISVGDYAVTVEAGPSYATAREQTREALMALVQSDPGILQVAGDIIVGAMDFPDHEELAERIQLMLPPPIQKHLADQKAEKNGQKPDPQQMQQEVAQMQQQMQQMGQMMQQLQAENQQLKQGTAAKIEAAKINAQADMMANDERMRVEREKADKDAELALRKAALDAQVKLTIAEMSAPQPADQVPIQTPDTMAMFAESIKALADSLNAETEHKFIFDANGEPVGAVKVTRPRPSSPMMVDQQPMMGGMNGDVQ